MRSIKLRAWDGDKFGYVSVGHDSVSWPAPDYFEQVFSGKREGAPEQVRFSKIEGFQQFTGLTDKNGREIYEGDILRSRENDEVYRVDGIIPLHRHTHITNIGYFSGKKYHSRVASAAYDNLDDWMSWPEMYEVIGNVHENPELIS